jgi:hypothetical protein
MISGNDTDAFIQIKFDLFDKQLNPLLFAIFIKTQYIRYFGTRASL